jgi:TolB-like protein
MTSLALVMLLSAAAADTSKPVVSVLYFDNSTGDASLDVMRKGFADMIITDLIAWDGVRVVERMRLEAVLGELKLQSSKAIDPKTAVKVGKIVGAQYAITGSLYLNKDKLRVDATVTSIQTGEKVASASITDDKDKIFDLEQLLVDKLTAAIDVKLRGSDGRKRAKVPSLDALLAYSKAIDLSDQGKIDEAQKAMAAVVSKSPTFVMAREKKQLLLKALEEFELRKKDLVSSAVLDVNKRADAELAKVKSFGAMKPDEKKAFIVWRTAKSRFLARLLKQSLSFRGGSTRVIRVGKEAAALDVMRNWVANQRLLVEELGQLEPHSSVDLAKLGLAELFRDAGLLEEVRLDPDSAAEEITDFVLTGRLQDGEGFHVAPQLGVLDPAEHARALKSLEDAVTSAEAAWKKAPAETRLRFEHDLSRAALRHGEKLEWLRRDDDAAAAYQKILDLLPTSDSAKRAEQNIQEIIGAKHSNDHSEREKFEKAIRTCEGLHAVGHEVGYRLRRKGLAGLDELDQQVDKACGLSLGTGWEIGNLYRSMAGDAAQHEDCDRAKRWYLKSFFYGEGPRSFEPYFKNEPWCSYGLTEATFPSKVRVTSVNRGYPDEKDRVVANGLEDILGEELRARGVAIERGGSHGGVLGVYVSVERKGDVRSIEGKMNKEDNGEIAIAAPFAKGGLDLNALFAPMLKELRAKNDPGGRKPLAKVSYETAAEYGAALQLYEDRKYEEALVAFDALSKKEPSFRLAGIRSAMAKAKLADKR